MRFQSITLLAAAALFALAASPALAQFAQSGNPGGSFLGGNSQGGSFTGGNSSQVGYAESPGGGYAGGGGGGVGAPGPIAGAGLGYLVLLAGGYYLVRRWRRQ